MAIYTVHMPPETSNRMADAERAEIVPEGFSWGAMIWGPLWLLGNRAWLGLFVWTLFAAALGFTTEALHPSRTAISLAALSAAIFFGFEGRQFVRARLERRGYHLADVVWARNAKEAEHAFFVRWLGVGGAARPGPSSTTGRSRAPAFLGNDVVGLFPEAGGGT